MLLVCMPLPGTRTPKGRALSLTAVETHLQQAVPTRHALDQLPHSSSGQLCLWHLHQHTSPSPGPCCLQFIYYLSSFFVQFGPNATTFLLAGEVFPTEARGLAHGISAAVGKVRSCFQDQALAWQAGSVLLHVVKQRLHLACWQCWRPPRCKLDA